MRVTDPNQLAASDNLIADVGKAVKSAGLTQATLAEKVGITPQFVCDLFGGRRKLSPKLLDAIGTAVEAHPVRRHRWHKLGAQAGGWRV